MSNETTNNKHKHHDKNNLRTEEPQRQPTTPATTITFITRGSSPPSPQQPKATTNDDTWNFMEPQLLLHWQWLSQAQQHTTTAATRVSTGVAGAAAGINHLPSMTGQRQHNSPKRLEMVRAPVVALNIPDTSKIFPPDPSFAGHPFCCAYHNPTNLPRTQRLVDFGGDLADLSAKCC